MGQQSQDDVLMSSAATLAVQPWASHCTPLRLSFSDDVYINYLSLKKQNSFKT